MVRAVREAVTPGIDDVRRTVREEIRNLEIRDRRDIFAASERAAVDSTAAFVAERMPTASTYPHRLETLNAALALAPDEGLALEFGVFSGKTLRIIAEGREAYGFDSFQGLPEAWRSGFDAGSFTLQQGNDSEELRLPDAGQGHLVVGWFDETLPGFLDEHPDPVGFLHVDCDLYSSTVTVLEHVGPRLRPGSVVLFDEYFNYPGWQRGEHLAWQEYATAHHVDYVYEGYTLADEQVIVRIR